MKKFVRKVFPEQKNPFKNLLLTAALCAVLRVALVVLGITMLSNGSPPIKLVGMAVLLLYPQIPDILFLRPCLKKTFFSPSFSKEHVTWLKERQDVSPDQLRVFFRKILSFRVSAAVVSLGIAIPSLIAIWLQKGNSGIPIMLLLLSPFLYLFFLGVKLSFFHSERLECWPRRYRSDRYNFPYRVRLEDNG